MSVITNHYQTKIALEVLHQLVDGLHEAGTGHTVRFGANMTPSTTRLRLVLDSDEDVRRLAHAVGLTPGRTRAGVFRAFGPWLGGRLTVVSTQKP